MRRRAEREARESRLASGWTVEADPAVGPAAGDAEPEEAAGMPLPGIGELLADAEGEAGDAQDRPQLSNGALVALGVVGGLYLLYTWVWFSWASHYSSQNSAIAEGSGVLGSVMQQIVFWAAPFAPALWFFSVLLLNRGGRTRTTMLWLLVGAVVLVPLPMFDFGAAQ